MPVYRCQTDENRFGVPQTLQRYRRMRSDAIFQREAGLSRLPPLDIVEFFHSDGHTTKRQRNINTANVRLLLGTSEEHFGEELEKAKFLLGLWLDGYFSGGSTFEGPYLSPILFELQAVEDFCRLGVQR